jgi:hypothetical protein
MSALAMIALGLVASACQPVLVDVHDVDNPYAEPVVKRVAVAPFLFSEKTLGLSYDFELKGSETRDGRYVLFSADIGQQFAQELAMFNGFEVIPPADVIAAWSASARNGKELNPLADAASARALCRVLKADAIVVGEVRSYDPYEYPRMELHWQLLYAGERAGNAGEDMLAWERRGQAGPFPIDSDPARRPLYVCNLVIDSQEARTRRELTYYARSLKATETGFKDSEEMIRKQPWPMYFRFASWLTLMDAFHYERNRS